MLISIILMCEEFVPIRHVWGIGSNASPVRGRISSDKASNLPKQEVLFILLK